MKWISLFSTPRFIGTMTLTLSLFVGLCAAGVPKPSLSTPSRLKPITKQVTELVASKECIDHLEIGHDVEVHIRVDDKGNPDMMHMMTSGSISIVWKLGKDGQPPPGCQIRNNVTRVPVEVESEEQ